LADDHAPTRESISAVLTPHYEIAGTLENGLALVEAARRLKPDLIVLDITMPLVSGIEAARQIKTDLPRIKMLFITMHSSSAYVKAALDAGGTGYVLKSGTPDELLEAVQSVMNGRIYVSSSLLTEHLEQNPAPSATSRLSKGSSRLCS